MAINSHNLFDYAGSIFSSNTSSTNLFNWENTDSLISIKYFFKDDKALRFSFGINYRNDKTDEIVQAFDDDLMALPGQTVRNIFIDENFRFSVRIGIENNYAFRKWRYYHGFDFGFSLESSRNRIINGNPLPLYLNAVLDDRFGETYTFSSFMLGGFEYMIMENASIGLEMGWGAIFQRINPGSRVVVQQNAEGEVIEVLEEDNRGITNFSLDNLPQARIKALIYLPINN